VLRLRSNRVLYGPPPAYAGRGRPRKHGAKFKLNASETWWPPPQQREVEDDTLGHLRLPGWTHVHFYQTAAVPMQAKRTEFTAQGWDPQAPHLLSQTTGNPARYPDNGGTTGAIEPAHCQL
jgi:hypothetical protein